MTTEFDYQLDGVWVIFERNADRQKLIEVFKMLKGVLSVTTSEEKNHKDARTVGDLRKCLEGLPDSMPVRIDTYDEYKDSGQDLPFSHSLVKYIKDDDDIDGPKELVLTGSRYIHEGET